MLTSINRFVVTIILFNCCTSNSQVLQSHSRSKRQSSREFAYPDPNDVLNKGNLPPLVFSGQKDVGLLSGQDKNLEDIRNQIKDLKMKTMVSNAAGGLLGLIPKAGSTIKATVNSLAAYMGSVAKLEDLKTDVKIQLGIDKFNVANSLSLLKSEIGPIQSRLAELVDPGIDTEERRLSVVPAIHSCQKVAILFADSKYAMWNFKSIFAPYLLTFAALYTTVAKISVELFPAKTTFLVEEMGLLLNTLNDYEPNVLKEMLDQIVIFDEGSLSMKYCPAIKVFWSSKNWIEHDTKISQWKNQVFYPDKTGCVQGDPNSNVVLQSSNAFHRGAKVFKNQISGELFCGWENCYHNLKSIYQQKIQILFEETRNLFPPFTLKSQHITRPVLNDPGCKRDSFGRLDYVKYTRAFGGDDDEYGCYKGKCWAYCHIPFSIQNDWCYTRNSKGNEKRATCTSKEDCCPEWRCGSACWAY